MGQRKSTRVEVGEMWKSSSAHSSQYARKQIRKSHDVAPPLAPTNTDTRFLSWSCRRLVELARQLSAKLGSTSPLVKMHTYLGLCRELQLRMTFGNATNVATKDQEHVDHVLEICAKKG